MKTLTNHLIYPMYMDTLTCFILVHEKYSYVQICLKEVVAAKLSKTLNIMFDMALISRIYFYLLYLLYFTSPAIVSFSK